MQDADWRGFGEARSKGRATQRNKGRGAAEHDIA